MSPYRQNYSAETTIWIGLTASDSNSTFLWTDGTPVSYTLWRQGNPDIVSAGQVAVKLKRDFGYYWVDREVDGSKDTFVCEREVNTTNTGFDTVSTGIYYFIS